MAMNTTANSEALVAEMLSRKILDRAEPELTVHKTWNGCSDPLKANLKTSPMDPICQLSC